MTGPKLWIAEGEWKFGLIKNGISEIQWHNTLKQVKACPTLIQLIYADHSGGLGFLSQVYQEAYQERYFCYLAS